MQHTQLFTTGFMASASDGLRRLMGSLAVPSRLKAGDVLFHQGDLGDALYALGSGSLEVSVLSHEGVKLTLHRMGPGDLVGEIALFAPGPRTATVSAIEPCEVWGVRNADVRAALRSDPDLQMDMIELAGQRMRWMGAQLTEQVFMDVATRLARRILFLAPEQGAVLKMSQSDLAAIVGTSRESVSKTLAGWKKQGVIDLGRGSLMVLDRDALSEFAEKDLT